MKKYILIILMLVLCSCTARKEVADVWSYIQERPDSALSVLNLLDVSSYHGRSLAEYQLLKAMAMDKNYIDVASDSLAGPAAEYFHRHGPKEKEMMALYYLGVSQYYAKDYNQSIVTFGRARDLAEDLSNVRYLGMIEACKSYVYHNGYNYADAIQSIKEAIGYFSELPDSTLQVRRAKMQLADVFISNRQFSEAYHLFGSILPTAPSDTFLQRRGLQNMAWSLYLWDSSRSDEALCFIQKALVEYKSGMDLKQLHHYGAILIESGHLEEAQAIIDELGKYEDSPELVASLQYRLYKRKGDYKVALEHYVSLLDYQNDFAREAMRQSVVKTQRDYYKKERDSASQELQWEHEKRVFSIIVFSLCAVIVFILALFWHRRVYEKQKQLLMNINDAEQLLYLAQTRNTALEGELEAARKKYVAAYKKQFQKISSLVEYYHATNDKRDGRDRVYKQVMELSASVGKDRQSMKALERSVNMALDNAFKVYQQEYPGRSRDHYNLVCYFMAGFPASLIGILTGMPRNTIYSKKQRLLDSIRDGNSSYRELLLRSIQ